jgi:hypothetical protein
VLQAETTLSDNTTKNQAVTMIHTEISLISSANAKYFWSHYNKYSHTGELDIVF